jgi:hypothetical protein
VVPFQCDAQEIQAVKAGLSCDPRNHGVGVLHEPTGQIHLMPMDDLPNLGGHAELVTLLNLPQAECKGFAVVDHGGRFVAVNNSHINGPQGQSGSLQMPPAVFQAIVQALAAAGL